MGFLIFLKNRRFHKKNGRANIKWCSLSFHFLNAHIVSKMVMNKWRFGFTNASGHYNISMGSQMVFK